MAEGNILWYMVDGILLWAFFVFILSKAPGMKKKERIFVISLLTLGLVGFLAFAATKGLGW